MRSRYFPLLFLLLASLQGNSQVIDGVWNGKIERSLLVAHPEKIVIELETQQDSLVSGLSHLYYKKGGYEHHKISGKFIRNDSSLIFTEDTVLAYKFGWSASLCQAKYTLKWNQSDSLYVLTGIWKDKKGKGMFRCPPLNIKLEKTIKDSHLVNDMSYGLNIHPKTLMRTSDIQHVIEITNEERDSIKIQLYDNGEIDGDSISVLFNDSIFMLKQPVGLRPIEISISLNNSNPFQKIKMVAENLGSIPPNTALMVITTRKKKYEIHLTSSMEKNAVVEFFLTQ